MAIPIDPITRKKLILVKQLYQQAVIQADAHQNYVNRIMSVIGFDLAAETVLKAVVPSLEQEKVPSETFGGLILQADKLLLDAGLNPVPDKVNIQRVHSLRNDAQHKAKYPNEIDVSDCRTYVRDFLQKIVFDVWGLSFREMSLADAIQYEEVKEHLIVAEAALRDGDHKEAVVRAEAGFRTALELVEAAFVGELRLDTSAFVTIDNYDEQKIDRYAYKAFRRMRKQFLLSTLGLDVSGYWRYDQIALSVVNYSTSIADERTQVNITEESVAPKDAEFAVAYAVNAVLQIESLVGNLNTPFGITW